MQSTGEVWKPVVGYEGFYEVSSMGRVRSMDRVLHDGHSWRGRVLKAVTRPDERLTVSVHREGRQRTRFIHHLVLEAFVGPRPAGMEACHWDGNPQNNKVGNLRWATHLDNEADKARHGTHSNSVKTECPAGHALVEPNIVAAEAERGYRKCRACNIARARAHKTGGEFDHELADRAFARIMSARIGVKNDFCPLGHPLTGPNLVPSSLKQGRRGCLACNRARGQARYRGIAFEPALAHERYALIVGEHA